MFVIKAYAFTIIFSFLICRLRDDDIRKGWIDNI